VLWGVLVIDDDPIIVKYLVSLLQDNGYETCSAGGGVEAFEVLQRERPDLITLDLEMPDEWGPRFYRRLSRETELKNTPVIIISGLAGRHAVKDAVAFISKPFDPDKLIGIVRRTLGK